VLSRFFEKLITGFFIFMFGSLWLFSTKYYEKPKNYNLVIYDVFGTLNTIDGLKTSFQTKQVADSFVKEYQRTFPQYSFSLLSELPLKGRRKIFDVLKIHK
jgi:hypothetical protein